MKHPRLVLALFVALVLPACGGGSPFEDLFSDESDGGVTAQANTPPPGTPMSDAELGLAYDVLGRINSQRASAGVAAPRVA